MDGTATTFFGSLVEDFATLGEWFWGLFTHFCTEIVNNKLLLWPIIFAIASGCIGLIIKVVRKFGLKGRR